jgi:hypothetical protein
MSRARKFLALPAPDRRLLAEAALLVGAARLGLWLLPFRALPGLLAKVAGRPSPPLSQPRERGRGGEGLPAERIAWAVAVVSSYVPAATCLTQALAAQALLARRDCPAQLRIGVARGAHGQLEAHAWLDVDGQAVIGGAISGRFTPLPNIKGQTL